MYQAELHQRLSELLSQQKWSEDTFDQAFKLRFSANLFVIHQLYEAIYGHREDKDAWLEELIDTILRGHQNRSVQLKEKDGEKEKERGWILSGNITGMSLYVDRFCGTFHDLRQKLPYFSELGVNLLHLMPVMESPENESDGGYAVSDFRNTDKRFGTLEDLKALSSDLKEENMLLMMDIVLNHTSHRHMWAERAKAGEKVYQDFYYMYPDRTVPDWFEQTMPEIFPDSSPGSFTYDEQSGKWVMTVFHHYQWDLNYSNPAVFIAMLDTIFFYANLGVDILRIDAPAFIWKKLGTTCQNLPEAHTLLQLIKHCVQVAAPGMALLGEAIVSPKEIMKYFGKGQFYGRECDVAYNATQMALQWDALATGDVRVMLAAQEDIQQKPYGTTWISYVRCHDDIGLGYDDDMIRAAGFDPFEHRKFLKNYYSGHHPGSTAKGALFGVNPKNQDARISGSLASLCGLEHALQRNDAPATEISVRKIMLMQAHSMFMGGIPMLFYGDEVGYTNDYTYLSDPGKSYDNRWMHRPAIDWKKNDRRKKKGTLEKLLFDQTKKLIQLRKKYSIFSDHQKVVWLNPHNRHIAGFKRSDRSRSVYCLFNYAPHDAWLTWFALREKGAMDNAVLRDLWSGAEWIMGKDHEHLVMAPYQFLLLEEV
jgi:amylosucrase